MNFSRWIILLCLITARIWAAGLDFPQTLKEIHAPSDAKTVSAEFEFSNRTDKPVTIKSFKPTCSCIAAEVRDGKLTYAPGETGLLRAKFDMGNFSGTVDKVIALWIEGDPEEKPSVALTVRVHIPVLIVTEPKTLKWQIGGDAGPQSVHITMNYTKPIHVTGVNSSSEAFVFDLKTLQDGVSYELIVTPKSINAQGLAVIRLETDCDIEKHKLQQVFAIVRKPTPGEAVK